MLLKLLKSLMNSTTQQATVKISFYDYIKEKYTSKGNKWDDVNIFGIRNEDDQDRDIFNDYIGIATNGKVYIYQGSTDPGKYWTQVGGYNKDGKGVAHLCHGYCRNVYQVGIHGSGSFAHEAMVQTGNEVKVWRDVNNNYTYDNGDTLEIGYLGINIHSTLRDDVVKVGQYSAGCQIIKNYTDHKKFMEIIKGSDKYKNNNKACFSYYLFTIFEMDTSYLK